MFRSFFDPQAAFWRGIGKVADVLGLSIAWLFLSLPVVTLGAATAALYDATAKCVMGGQNGPFVRFFSTFRQELKTGTLATLLWGGICGVLIWCVWTLRAHVTFEGATGALVLALWYAVLLVPCGALCWMFPTLSRFTSTPVALGPTALRLALGFFPRTFAIVVVALAGVVVSLWLMVPMLAMPCLVAMVWTKLMENVFQKFEKV